jgi:hypothetical protein
MRYTYTGDPIPDAVAEAMDEVDSAHNALVTALVRADYDDPTAYEAVALAREWVATAEARYTELTAAPTTEESLT